MFGSEKNAKIMALAQLVGDAHRDLQIAFAKDLYLYCQANGINFTQLRAALNSKWNVNVPDLEGGSVTR
jgi:UDP-N-acetyl-D-mannosaminuronate dehydrogenase